MSPLRERYAGQFAPAPSPTGLDDKAVSKIAAAGVLAACASGELSDFERDTLRAVSARFLEFGPETNVTPAEWDVIDVAILAMRQILTPAFTVSVQLDPTGRRGVTRCVRA